MSFIEGIFVLASGAGCALVLVTYVQALIDAVVHKKGWKDRVYPPEPAFLQYFYRQGFGDCVHVVRTAWARTLAAVAAGKGHMKVFGPLIYIAVPPAIIASLFAVALYSIVSTIHALLVAVGAVVVTMGAGLFRLVEYASMVRHRASFVCPSCHNKFAFPIYLCPDCLAEHKQLWPGLYGTLHRRCRCGKKLPTLFLMGRQQLQAQCPLCSRSLSGQAGSLRNIHIPVVAGPASGKTSFLMGCLVQLHAQSISGRIKVSFPEDAHQRLFDAAQAAFAKGEAVAKTADYSPDAFLVRLTDAGAKEGLLYVYDAAGELYQQTDVLRTHRYYEHLGGVLFVLDPFSLPNVRLNMATQLSSVEDAVKPGEELPQHVYGRMTEVLREMSPSGQFADKPIAVVITKADSLRLDAEFRGRSVLLARKEKPDPDSAAVRNWLMEKGEGNLVRSLEQDFKSVRYFYCSALGRSPDRFRRPFRPDRVLQPLAWILSYHGLDLDDWRSGRSRALVPPAPKVRDSEARTG